MDPSTLTIEQATNLVFSDLKITKQQHIDKMTHDLLAPMNHAELIETYSKNALTSAIIAHQQPIILEYINKDNKVFIGSSRLKKEEDYSSSDVEYSSSENDDSPVQDHTPNAYDIMDKVWDTNKNDSVNDRVSSNLINDSPTDYHKFLSKKIYMLRKDNPNITLVEIIMIASEEWELTKK